MRSPPPAGRSRPTSTRRAPDHAPPRLSSIVSVVRDAPLDLDGGLARLGYPAFRPGQREAIETLLTRGRLLLVAPTGGGKSLIYQLPASLLRGTSLVVSPLISHMHDQVAALSARGVPATFLASTLDAGEMRRRMRDMAAGAFRLVYVAPERLAFPGFRALVADLSCPLRSRVCWPVGSASRSMPRSICLRCWWRSSY